MSKPLFNKLYHYDTSPNRLADGIVFRTACAPNGFSDHSRVLAVRVPRYVTCPQCRATKAFKHAEKTIIERAGDRLRECAA